ncbi:uncharacterized protein LOC144129060 isoform X2 [Amblyomma americanum]
MSCGGLRAFRCRKSRCAIGVFRRITLLAIALSIAPAGYFLLHLLKGKANKPEYSCDNRNHGNVTSSIREFDSLLAGKLLESDSGQDPLFEDDDAWVLVLPRTYVYSAYMDDSEPGNCQVRLISVVPRDAAGDRAVQCWISVGSAVFLSEASLKVLPEHHDLPYAAAFFACPVKFPSEVRGQPNMRVALGTNWNMSSPKWFKVHNRRQQPPKFLSACVRPMVGHFSALSLVTEFVAYYAAMGVGRFDFYLCQVPRETEILLSLLRNRGKVDIRLHRWNLYLNGSYILEHGQLAAIQDCLYRSKLTSEYVLNVDFDEFLVSKTRSTLSEALLEIEGSVGKRSLGSVVVKNQFFCYEYPFNAAYLRQKPPLLTRILFVREANPWKHRERSKYAARASAVATGGVHFVWEHTLGAREVAISESVMVMHHYRSCCGLKKSNFWGSSYTEVLTKEGVVIDKSMYAFAARLLYSDVITFIKELIEEPTTEPPLYTYTD